MYEEVPSTTLRQEENRHVSSMVTLHYLLVNIDTNTVNNELKYLNIRRISLPYLNIYIFPFLQP